MDAQLWKKIKRTVDELLDLGAEEREDRISGACGGDPTIEREVRGLLAAAAHADAVLDNVKLPDDQETAAPTIDAQRFSRYSGLEKIGAGGMGVVYKALDTWLNREVALKFLSNRINDDEQARRRFYAEAKAISQVDHQNVCAILDIGESPDGQLYFAMPFYEGWSLKERIRDNPPSVHEAIELIIQVCKAIRVVHQHGVIHRDIKPANVQITTDNVVKVLDFGIAKVADSELTRTGQAVGTTAYMSPEQLRGDAVDLRTDIWSIGVLLYELMATRRPFIGKSNLVISTAILECQLRPVSEFFFAAPPILERIVARTLCADPDGRYPNIDELLKDVETLRDKECFIRTRRGPLVADQDNLEDGDSGGSSGNDIVGETLGHIINELSRYVGPNARILVNTLSQHTDTVGELCERLAEELAEPKERQQFLQSVGRLAFVSPSAGDVTERATTGRGFHTGMVWMIAVAILAALIGWALYEADTRDVVIDEIESLLSIGSPTRGVGSDTLLLGMTAPFSGAARELGRAMQVGMDTRFQEVNAAGGIHGRRVALMALDDRYEPDRATQNLQTLLNPDDGVFALIGSVGTQTAKAILPDLMEDRTLLFGTISGAEFLRESPPDRYVFNYRASYADETEALVRYFVETEDVNPANMGVFYQNDSFGLDALAGVERALQRYGVKKEPLLATYERNTAQVDHAVEVMTMEKDRLEAIIVASTYQASALFTRSLRRNGYTGSVANVSFVGSTALAEEFRELGSEFGKGVIISQVVPYYDSHATGVLNYRNALEKYYPNESPGFTSLEGYIIATIFCEALERTGRRVTTDAVVGALQSMSAWDLGIGPTISFGKSRHQASHYVWGTRLTEQGTFEHVHLLGHVHLLEESP